jgi:hypothetical protein
MSKPTAGYTTQSDISINQDSIDATILHSGQVLVHGCTLRDIAALRICEVFGVVFANLIISSVILEFSSIPIRQAARESSQSLFPPF